MASNQQSLDPSFGAKQELTDKGRVLVAECGQLAKAVQRGCGTENVLRMARACINNEGSINNTASVSRVFPLRFGAPPADVNERLRSF